MQIVGSIKVSTESKHFGFSIGLLVVVGVLVIGIFSAIKSGVLTGEYDADMSAEAVAKRIEPVAKLNTGEAIVPEAAPAAAPAPAETTAAAAGRSGEEVYNTVCFACHAQGVAGAPMIGNKEAWAPRIEQGLDILAEHAINGFQGSAGLMPAKGGNPSLSDAEVRAAVEYMVSQSQ